MGAERKVGCGKWGKWDGLGGEGAGQISRLAGKLKSGSRSAVSLNNSGGGEGGPRTPGGRWARARQGAAPRLKAH
jgi:hypothetical protein